MASTSYGMGVRWVAILSKGVRVIVIEKRVFEKRLTKSEGMSHTAIRGKSFLFSGANP